MLILYANYLLSVTAVQYSFMWTSSYVTL